jgi:uncharacterized membrane protein YbhN (UPF0104 family)
MLIGQRVLFWLILALIVLFAFAFQLSSLATFLGLVSAGIAVALQNVILAVVGYFLLVGKLRIRLGASADLRCDWRSCRDWADAVPANGTRRDQRAADGPRRIFFELVCFCVARHRPFQADSRFIGGPA